MVVDAGDFMTSEGFVKTLCGRIGLEGRRACFGWEAVAREGMHPMLWASQNTLFESEGVDAARAKEAGNLVEEERAWEEEFGGDVGLVREMVGIAEPFYRWLFERRWKADV